MLSIYSKNGYYVYILLDPRKAGSYIYGKWVFPYEPFYVGKGKGNRARAHGLPWSLRSSTNPHKNRKILNLLRQGMHYRVLYVGRGLTEEAALSLERLLVRTIGRHNCAKGPLTNNAKGGERGNTGWIPSTVNRHNIAEATRKWFARLTPNKRKQRALRIAEATKRVHESRSEKEKQELALRISEGKKRAFSLMTNDEKEQYSAKLRHRKIKRTPKQLSAFKRAVASASRLVHLRMSAKTKQDRRIKISKAMRRVWAKRERAERLRISSKISLTLKLNKNAS